MPEDEMHSILDHCHTLPCGGHFGGQRTAAKVLQSGFIGLPYLKMLINSFPLVKNVNEWGTSLERTSHPCIPYWR